MLYETVLFCFLLSIYLPQIKMTILKDYNECNQIYHDHGDSDYQYTEFYEVTGPSSENEFYHRGFYDKVTASPPSEPDDSILYFKFAVKASSDVHILLATNNNSSKNQTISDAVYEIFIRIGAGKYNSMNIRKAHRGKKVEKVSSEIVQIKNVLPKMSLRPFWIRITKNGVISLGKEGNETALVSWTDPDQNPLPVNVISFSSARRNKIESTFYFDCGKADDDDILSESPSTMTVHIPSTPELVESALWLLPFRPDFSSAKSPTNSAYVTLIALFISSALLIYT